MAFCSSVDLLRVATKAREEVHAYFAAVINFLFCSFTHEYLIPDSRINVSDVMTVLHKDAAGTESSEDKDECCGIYQE